MPISRSLLRLTPDELDAFLTETRTCRIATVSSDGHPHLAPLWFVWQDKALWVSSLRRSRRSSDIGAGSRVAVCVDDGETYQQLRGCVLYGLFVDAAEEDHLPAVRRVFADTYFDGHDLATARSHQWLVLRPDRIVSWDFSKIPARADPRLAQRPAQGDQ